MCSDTTSSNRPEASGLPYLQGGTECLQTFPFDQPWTWRRPGAKTTCTSACEENRPCAAWR
eukprot:2443755-Pyramimonas_sp.AAC.1